MSIYKEYFGKNKSLRHELQHILVGIFAILILYVTKNDINIFNCSVLLIATLAIDLDHLLSMIIMYRGKSEFYKEFFTRIKSFKIKNALEYATTNHKVINRLLFHNVISLTVLIIIFNIIAIVDRTNIAFYFLTGILAHLFMDFIDDIYQMGNVNNWLWPFNTKQ